MTYTNAQVLAAVLTTWSRPAISQIASSKLLSLAPVKSIEDSIKSLGIVGANYTLAAEIQPFMHNAIDILIEPVLQSYLANIPDASIPALAHSIVDTAMQESKLSILDGLVEFDSSDLQELKDLLNKNLPLSSNSQEKYQVVK